MMSARTYVIPNDKLTRYLLDPSHKKGASKAKFFLARGFDVAALPTIAAALFEHAERCWPGRVYPEQWGSLYELVGEVACPDGTSPRILAVWKIEAGQSVASFVTAYPFHATLHHP